MNTLSVVIVWDHSWLFVVIAVIRGFGCSDICAGLWVFKIIVAQICGNPRHEIINIQLFQFEIFRSRPHNFHLFIVFPPRFFWSVSFFAPQIVAHQSHKMAFQQPKAKIDRWIRYLFHCCFGRLLPCVGGKTMDTCEHWWPAMRHLTSSHRKNDRAAGTH